MGSIWSRILAVLVVLVVFSSMGRGIAQQTTVVVGIYQNQPKIFQDETGQAKGFFPEIVAHLARSFDWRVEYAPCEWADCLKRLEAGEIHIMPDVAFSPAREKLFQFGHEAILHSWSYIYSGRDLTIGALDALDGLRIAVLKDSIQLRGLNSLAERRGWSVDYVAVDSLRAVLAAVETGRADAGIVNNFFGEANEGGFDLERSILLFQPGPLYLAYPKAFPEETVRSIDAAIALLKADPKSIYYRAVARWLTPATGFDPPRWFYWVIAALGAVLLASVAANAHFHKRVAAATAAAGTSEERFRDFAETGSDVFWETDDELRFTSIIEHREPRIYPDLDRFLGRTLWDAAGAVLDDDEGWENLREDCVARRPYRGFRFTDTDAAGGVRHISASGKPFFDTTGRFRGYRGTFTDITGQTSTEAAKFEIESRFQAIVDGSPAAITLKDADGRILVANRTYCEWMRLDPFNVVGHTVFDLFPRQDAIEIEANDRSVFRSGVGITFRAVRNFGDGVERLVLTHKSPVRAPGGEITAVATILTDITVQDELEREQIARQERTRRFNETLATVIRSESLAVGPFEAFAREVCESTSEVADVKRVSVWKRAAGGEEIVCVDLWDQGPRHHISGLRLSRNDCPSYFDALTTDRIMVFDDVYDDPRTRELAEDYLPGNSITSMLDAAIHLGGKIAGVLCLEHVGEKRQWSLEEQSFCISVTDLLSVALEAERRRGAERALADNQQQLLEAQRIAHIGNWARNPETGWVHWSDEVYRIFGLEPGSVVPSLDFLVRAIHPDDRARFEESIKKALATAASHSLEYRIFRPDGTQRWVETNAVVTTEEDGKTRRLSGTLQDITDRKLDEEMLRLARDEAEEANNAKSDFLAAMSHELRTPLNAILGFTEMIRYQGMESLNPGKVDEYIGDIHSSGRHLLSLVNDLLDLSAIEAGQRPLVKENVSLAKLMQECARSMDGSAREKNIEVVTEVANDQFDFYADPRAMRQIVLNLISNAVKFTPAGGKVTLAVEASNDTTRIEIKDTGVGIPEDMLPTITDPFTRNDPDPHLAYEGSGLGLAIANSLVTLHGGDLKIESRVGEGTTVRLTFPNGKD